MKDKENKELIVNDSEFKEKLDLLTKSELSIIELIKNWLIENRGYKDYDFTDEFEVEKLIPLLKLVEHKELVFNENSITQILRMPIELKNRAGDVEKKITELTYRVRYQDYELQNYTKGINISKEPMAYVNAQIALLTNNARSVIGKLYDTDSNNTKLVSALYFLG